MPPDKKTTVPQHVWAHVEHQVTVLPTGTITHLPLGVNHGHQHSAIFYINNAAIDHPNAQVRQALAVASLFLLQCELTTIQDVRRQQNDG